MKILDIRGTSDTIRFIMDNGNEILAEGELQMDGFEVSRSSLTLKENNNRRVLKEKEKDDFVIKIKDFLKDKEFKIFFSE